ncbi:MAG: hypothetical protein ACYTHJ_13875 [Planctomycetota bacterium]
MADKANDNPDAQRWQQAMTAVIEGRWDDVPDDLLEKAESYLEAHPEIADKLAAATPVPDANLPDIETEPDESAWEECWQGIEERLESPVDVVRRSHWIRNSSFLGLAAALTFMVTWRWLISPAGVSAPIALATSADAVIETVEVYDDSMSFVVSAGEDEDVAVIWVVEEET